MNWQIAKTFIVFIVLVGGVWSCKSKPEDIGADLQENKVQTFMVDTFSVDLSTVIINDSIITDFVTSLLVGEYNDGEFGKVITKSYFQPLLPSNGVVFTSSDINFVRSKFNKIELVLPQNYYYGLTSSSVKFTVNQLTEEFNKSTYYSTDTLNYDTTVLGEAESVFSSNDTLTILLDSTFGKSIYNGNLTNQSNLDQIIKGLTLQYKQGDGIAGFDLLEDDFKLILYYKQFFIDSIINSDTVFRMEEKNVHFRINSDSKRFNYINSNRNGTPLVALSNNYDTISGVNSANKLYLQAGIGIKTKLSFPTLNSFLEKNKSSIIVNKAEININTQSSSYAIPSSIVLFETNDSGKVENIISTQSGGSAGTVPALGNSYKIELDYHFQLKFANNDNINSFIIGPTSNIISVNRAVIDNTNKDAVKLKIYYTRF